MSTYKSNLPLRLFYLFVAGTIWLGIYMTGFSAASWILYIPAITLIIGAMTGYCPSLISFRKALHQ